MAGLILLSGGLDSTVAASLYKAAGGEARLGLFIDYGQRAVEREELAAIAVGQALGFEVLCTSVPLLGALAGNALIDGKLPLPCPGPGELEGAAAAASADAVWIPNRNGVLLNLAAAVAEAHELELVIVGFNKEEAATFPDNSADYLDALNASLVSSTRARVRVEAPTLHMTKAELYAAGRAVEAPLELTWSCYDGGEQPCGECESCRRRSRAEQAFEASGGA
jgi:7-cyano-7-deazaguanine synthase